MKKIFASLFVLGLTSVLFASGQAKTEKQIYKEAKKIVSQMTLEEKAGQLVMADAASIMWGLDVPEGSTREAEFERVFRKMIVEEHIRAFVNFPDFMNLDPESVGKFIENVQDLSLNKSNSKVKTPSFFGMDNTHGIYLATGTVFFPHEIGVAATWNPALAEELAQITAYESRAINIPLNFSPSVDIASHPAWSRQYENFGEDPYIVSVFGAAYVKGMQGEDNDLSKPGRIAAMGKHFVGYGVPVSGKDRTPSVISDRALWEYHLPPYKALIDAGLASMMISAGVVNDEPVLKNYDLITGVLKEKLGFKGLISSDWADANRLFYRMSVAEDMKDSAVMVANAGVDMNMVRSDVQTSTGMSERDYKAYLDALIEAVKSGKIKKKRLDDAAINTIALKLKLDLFDTPNTYFKDYPLYGGEAHRKAAYNTTAESITLLKNEDNILPLKTGKKILVVGPNADSRRTIHGIWSYDWKGETTETLSSANTFLTAVKNKFGAKNVTYYPGVSYTGNEGNHESYVESKNKFNEAVAAAKTADYVILFLGEQAYAEHTGARNDITLGEHQLELAQAIAKNNKNTVLVLNAGRPVIIHKILPGMKAVMQTYVPGTYGGDVTADILAGDVNPSGKLPYTYPFAVNSLEPYYHKNVENAGVRESASDYAHAHTFQPDFHFGFGLSYTTFEFSNARLVTPAKVSAKSKDDIIIKVDVTNTGDRAGLETVQLYSSQLLAPITPDVRRLRRFEKIALEPGQTKTVTFTLKLDDLAYYNPKVERTIGVSKYKFQVGSSSNDMNNVLDFEVTEK